MVKLRYSSDELARLGDAVYDREVAPRRSAADAGRFVAYVDSEAFAVGADELSATDAVPPR